VRHLGGPHCLVLKEKDLNKIGVLSRRFNEFRKD